MSTARSVVRGLGCVSTGGRKVRTQQDVMVTRGHGILLLSFRMGPDLSGGHGCRCLGGQSQLRSGVSVQIGVRCTCGWHHPHFSPHTPRFQEEPGPVSPAVGRNLLSCHPQGSCKPALGGLPYILFPKQMLSPGSHSFQNTREN